MVICLFVFTERDPSLFFPIVNLNTNVCVEAVVGRMSNEATTFPTSKVKGGPQAVPSTTYIPLHPLGPARTSLFFQNRLTKKEVGWRVRVSFSFSNNYGMGRWSSELFQGRYRPRKIEMRSEKDN
jgi:hypothetical protein